MYSSQNIGAHEEQRMEPKDERLVLMAYNVGKMEQATEELWSLKNELKQANADKTALRNRVESLERSVSSWSSSYRALEHKYDNLKKKTSKKKVVKK